MNVEAVERWLEQHTGLVADKLGPGQVARTTRERMRVTGASDAEAYVALLSRSLEEQLHFIEDIIVAETWFFRDRAALDGLVRQIVGRWAARNGSASFRVLSVPCSTGEEPYSVAMALALGSWPAARLQIDAVDISRENIGRGLEAVYRKNSFRGADIAFREIFFETVGTGDAWRLRDAIRAPVRFQEGNLLADDFAAGRPLYDAILCRNLLIYFDPPVQARVFRTLARLLADDGLLVVGPAEAVLALENGFAAVPGESMFLFQKAVPKVRAAPPAAAAQRRARPKALPAIAKTPAPGKISAVAPRSAEPMLSPVQKLRALADAGRLDEAKTLGATLLRAEGATVDLCYLIAVVADAAGDGARAEEFYRKTLYLDPRHAESLMHLALLLEKQGDRRAAATLRARARRTPEPSAPVAKAREAV